MLLYIIYITFPVTLGSLLWDPGSARNTASPSASILCIMAFGAEYKPNAETILLSLLATFAYHLILHLPHELFL